MEIVAKLIGLFFTSFVIGLSGALMPGPMLAVTLSEAPRRGAVAGPLIVAGHAVLEGALVAAIALGLASFLQQDAVIGAIGLLGGAMLLWMGQSMVRSSRTMSLVLEADAARGRMHPAVAGVVTSISNPYWTIWWATIGFSYIVLGLKFGMIGVIAFFFGHILADLVWYSAVAFGLSKGRKLMSDRVYRGLVAVCGALLVVFGGWFFVSGLVRLT